MSHELSPLIAIVSGRILGRKGPVDAQERGLAGGVRCASAVLLSAEKSGWTLCLRRGGLGTNLGGFVEKGGFGQRGFSLFFQS